MRTKPQLLMKNIDYSVINKNFLKGINLRVYEAERIVLVSMGNSGIDKLINLILLNIRRDEKVYQPSLKTKRIKRNSKPKSTKVDKKLLSSALKQFEPDEETRKEFMNADHERMENNNYENTSASMFEMLGQNVDYCKPDQLLRDIFYLNEYPLFFLGTVRENIDPENIYDDKLIIKTLHFLKVFEALQKFTGKETANEIALTIKQKEGKIDINHVDIDDFLNLESDKDRDKDDEKDLQKLELKLKYSKSSKALDHKKGENSKKAEEKKKVDEKVQKIYSEYFKQKEEALMDEPNYDICEFFDKQTNDEVPIAERARRIDERLQVFDFQYKVRGNHVQF